MKNELKQFASEKLVNKKVLTVDDYLPDFPNLYDDLVTEFFDPYAKSFPDYETNGLCEYPEFTGVNGHIVMTVFWEDGLDVVKENNYLVY